LASQLGADFDKLTWAPAVSNVGDGLRSVFAMNGLVYVAMIVMTWRVSSNHTIRAAEAGAPR
jgi:hypothetical protein